MGAASARNVLAMLDSGSSVRVASMESVFLEPHSGSRLLEHGVFKSQMDQPIRTEAQPSPPHEHPRV